MRKKMIQNAIRVSSEFFDLERKMMSNRCAESFSAYIRGLVLLDAAYLSPDLLVGHDLPGWITRDKRFEEYFLTRNDHAGEKGASKMRSVTSIGTPPKLVSPMVRHNLRTAAMQKNVLLIDVEVISRNEFAAALSDFGWEAGTTNSTPDALTAQE